MNGPMKILIAYDGSPCADNALLDMQRAGLPPQANARILSVAEAWIPELEQTPALDDGATADSVHARAYKAIEEAHYIAGVAAQRVQGNFPGWQVEPHVISDSPALGILRMADSWKPDLIVVGSHGHSALERLLLGSVSRKVLTESHSSVRIARHQTTVDDSPVRIIIGTDGTPDAEAAVRTVASRNWPAGSAARVIAVHGAVDVAVPPFGSYMTFSIQEAIAKQYSLLETAVRKGSLMLHEAGLAATGEVIEGKPVPTLLHESKEWGADAIFVGARGHGFFERFLLGSVSASLAARAHCSVEVVRTDRPKVKE